MKKENKAEEKWLFFEIGLIVSLIIGWVIFPGLIYSKKDQPVHFSHLKHREGASLKCEDCHFFGDDGSFAGIPKLDKCLECHGESEISKKEQEQIKRGVAWYIYSKQPDHVFFSHAAHIKSAKIECKTCHKWVSDQTDENPPYRYKWVSDYAPEAMKMKTCESCHEKNGKSNACFVCHK